MSKLTDKIAVLMLKTTEAASQRGIVTMDFHDTHLALRSILADVRELENDLTNGAAYENGYADGQDETEAAAAPAIRQAKHEAYEHALHLASLTCTFADVGSLREKVLAAIDAFDTQGNSDE